MAEVLTPPPPLPVRGDAAADGRKAAWTGAAAPIDYDVIRSRLQEFLSSFVCDNALGGDEDGVPKYMGQLREIAHRTRKTLEIELDDIYKWGISTLANSSASDGAATQGTNGLLHEDVEQNGRRYQELFSEAADALLETMRTPLTESGEHDDEMDHDQVDVLIETRRQRELEFRRQQALAQGPDQAGGETDVARPDGPGGDPNNLVPAVMTRTYEMLLLPRRSKKALPLRNVRSANVGHLVSVQGIVTRVTEVKPRVVVAAYVCHGCGYEVYQEVTGRSYMPAMTCPTQNHTNGTSGQLVANYSACKYVKYQEMKLQEPADQVPIGNIPRTLNVKLSGELTRKCTSGDVVKVSGIFLPVPFTGYRAMKAGFLADTFVEATQITQLKKHYDEDYLDDDTKHELHTLRHSPDVYDRLSRSIAPEIFGHADVKKALLLQLLGAPPKVLPDGMRLRGDLHICLMGDPGVAKSQFLKHVSTLSPRAVYTTGKGSSGVGLTAAVLRDSTTNELMLEGGALVIADMGIACIDEFDKMNEADRTAIHEVMEQQTVSIAKAGITTSLNARTSVLAASNPAYGRYNRSRAPSENINLPAALLSRFDLMFLLLDEPNDSLDLQLARHVTHVHRTGTHPALGFAVVDTKVIRAHIAEARKLNPIIPHSDGTDTSPDVDGEDLTEYLVSNYVAMRAREVNQGGQAKEYTSPRMLLSVLRLAQAICRLRLSRRVSKADVDEALRLMTASKSSVDGDGKRRRRRADDDADEVDLDSLIEKGDSGSSDKVWGVYTAISEYMQRETRTVVDLATAQQLCEDRGYTNEDLMKTIEQYEDMDIWTFDSRELRIALV